MDDEDGCTTVYVYLIPLNARLIVKTVSFVYILHDFLKKNRNSPSFSLLMFLSVLAEYKTPPQVRGAHPTLQVSAEPRAELPVVYGSFPLASFFARGGVYTSVLLPQFVSPSPCPSVSPSSVLCVCISIPALQTGSSVPFF